MKCPHCNKPVNCASELGKLSAKKRDTPSEAIKRQLPSEHSSYGITTAVYIPPEQALRNQADKIEQDRGDRQVIQEWLDSLEE